MRIHSPHQFFKLLRAYTIKHEDVPLQALHSHYNNLLNPIPTQPPTEKLQECTQPTLPQYFHSEDISHAISKLKNHKSLGSCNISAEVLKSLKCDSLCECLATMFNMFLVRGLPACWNTLTLTSLYKTGDRSDAANYRGISIMHVFSKLYSTCLTERLESFASDHALRSEVQCGFRPGFRLEDHCTILRTIV